MVKLIEKEVYIKSIERILNQGIGKMIENSTNILLDNIKDYDEEQLKQIDSDFIYNFYEELLKGFIKGFSKE